mmetsp:Transcript_10449/g.23710  ORF Transcript_10449/g.23710 Transcript_10449/m.23710 type:complete len:204 (+) Transcript_10449:472-1083(+)
MKADLSGSDPPRRLPAVVELPLLVAAGAATPLPGDFMMEWLPLALPPPPPEAEAAAEAGLLASRAALLLAKWASLAAAGERELPPFLARLPLVPVLLCTTLSSTVQLATIISALPGENSPLPSCRLGFVNMAPLGSLVGDPSFLTSDALFRRDPLESWEACETSLALLVRLSPSSAGGTAQGCNVWLPLCEARSKLSLLGRDS